MHERTVCESVLRACKRYARVENFEWHRESGVGTIVVPYGFFGDYRRLWIEPNEEFVRAGLTLLPSVPLQFSPTVWRLHVLSNERIFLWESGELVWAASVTHEAFDNHEGITTLIHWAMREAFIVESLARMFRVHKRQYQATQILGLGYQSEFDLEH